MFSQNHVPKTLAHSVMIPLIKDPKKGYSSPNNYRGISLVSILSKVIELIILELSPELKNTSYLQHGFKQEISTIHATYTVRETIQHYHNSNLYTCSLDAENVFDNIYWKGLFYKLIPQKLWYFIYRYYHSFTFIVSYQKVLSNPAKTHNSVKQGGSFSIPLRLLHKRSIN